MLNGSNKQVPELTLAISNGVTINIDVLDELLTRRGWPKRCTAMHASTRAPAWLAELDDAARRLAGAACRRARARAHKFGMTYEDVRECCARGRSSSDWLDLRGLHHHVGRWTNDLRGFRAVVREQVAWAARLCDDRSAGRHSHLNIGGGLAWGRPGGSWARR